MLGGRPHDCRSVDVANWRQAVGSRRGCLRTFNDAGVIESADVHVAQRLTALVSETDERVALAVALVVRALRGGSVCVDLRSVEAQVGRARSAVACCRRLAGGGAGESAARLAAGAAPRRRAALPRPVLAGGAAGRRRSVGDARRCGPIGGGSRYRPVVPGGLRGAAGSRRNRAVTRVDGAHRWTRDGQDDNGRTAAGAVRRAGGAGREGATANRAGGADGQGGGEAAGGGAAGGRQAGHSSIGSGCPGCGR